MKMPNAPMFAAVNPNGEIVKRFPTWDEATGWADSSAIWHEIINLEYDADDPAYWRENPEALG